MPAQLPRTLKVGSRHYTVTQKSLGNRPYIGLCHPYHGRITLEKSLPADYKAEVSLHESLHAIFYACDFNLDAEDEERLVRALSRHLAAFLCDNPRYVKYLLSNLAPSR